MILPLSSNFFKVKSGLTKPKRQGTVKRSFGKSGLYGRHFDFEAISCRIMSVIKFLTGRFPIFAICKAVANCCSHSEFPQHFPGKSCPNAAILSFSLISFIQFFMISFLYLIFITFLSLYIKKRQTKIMKKRKMETNSVSAFCA